MPTLTLITGASSGLGRNLADRMTAPVLLQGRNEERLRAVGAAAPEGSRLWPIDLAEAPDAGVALNQALGDDLLEGIIHCAGYLRIHPTRMQRPDELEKLFRVHLFSLHAMVARCMAAGKTVEGFRVTLVSSAGAYLGDPGNGAYTGAKSAVEAWAQSADAEGLDVRVFRPGFFLSEMGQRFAGTPDARSALESVHPLGLGDVDNMAELLLHLHQRSLPIRVLTADGGRLVRPQGT